MGDDVDDDDDDPDDDDEWATTMTSRVVAAAATPTATIRRRRASSRPDPVAAGLVPPRSGGGSGWRDQGRRERELAAAAGVGASRGWRLGFVCFFGILFFFWRFFLFACGRLKRPHAKIRFLHAGALATSKDGDLCRRFLACGWPTACENRVRTFAKTNSVAVYDDALVRSHVKLEHPSTFATLAMDPVRKQEIIDDLDMFRDGKEYYASVGKAWKRGYLLFGPPGTGKSTMIAAMANFLDYDVYDLELTAFKSNTELRRLFIETTGKSIIVIEDIDCSIDLTGKRKKKKKDKKKKKMTPPWARDDDEEKKVTLSGLLNFIDGLWSACGGERIIIFTTNHKEKLDPALIRRGRMDMHIEMSYCCFESFKVLAKNYLGVEQHELFGEIRRLLEEADMSPADVAENLMPRSKTKDVDACLERLVKALHEAKEAALSKAAAAGKKKADEEIKDDYDKDPKDMKEK